MVNKPLIRPFFLGEVALGGVARIPMTKSCLFFRNLKIQSLSKNRASYLDLENYKIVTVGNVDV